MERGKLFEATMLLVLLFLCAALYLMVAGGDLQTLDRWSLSAVSSTAYTFAGDGGYVYLFDGNVVYAVKDGQLKWKYMVPPEWSVINDWNFNPKFYGRDNYGSISSQAGTYYTGPVFSSSNDTLYLYAAPKANAGAVWSEDDARAAWRDQWNASKSGEMLIAVRDGHLIWKQQMPKGAHEYYYAGNSIYDDVSLYARDDRLYVFHGYNVTVLDGDGKLLYTVSNVSTPPALDEDGYLYTITTAMPAFPDEAFRMANPAYTEPSALVESYYPNGTLRWRTDIGKPAVRQNIDPSFGLEHRTLPLYGNGVLYVPFADGVVTLDCDGKVLRTNVMNRSISLYEKMPFDSEGNVYLVDVKAGYLIRYPLTPALRDTVEQAIIADRKIYVAGKDGDVSTVNESYEGGAPLAAAEGIAYYVTSAKYDANRPSMDSLLPLDVTALDLCSDTVLWTQPLPQGPVSSMTLNQSNLDWVFYDDGAREKTIAYNNWHPTAWNDSELMYRVCGDARWISMLPYGGNIYVSYYSLNYEYPSNYESWTDPLFLRKGWSSNSYIDVKGSPYMAVFDRSRCDYAAGIIALADDGQVLWQRPTGAYVTGMAVNNSTIFYGTGKGDLSATSAE
ncbi:MAG TPA: PQQ-binding-like beta-propeller repeat protein, partial [Methanocella sp.]